MLVSPLKQATTARKVRALIQASMEPVWVLATRVRKLLESANALVKANRKSPRFTSNANRSNSQNPWIERNGRATRGHQIKRCT